MRWFNAFRIRKKISASFGVLIALMLLNALVVVLGTYMVSQQRAHKEAVGRVVSEVDQVRLQVAGFVNTGSRSAAQQVFSGLDNVRQKIALANQGLDEPQLRAMQPLLDDFRLQFQKYMAETDQTAALRSRALLLGQRMVGHFGAVDVGELTAADHRALHAIQPKAMALLWAGQAAQLVPARQALQQLRDSSHSAQAGEVFALVLFRILRDASDYVDSLVGYQQFQNLNVQTGQTLSQLSDRLQRSSETVSAQVDATIRRHIQVAFTLMALVAGLTLLSAVVLSRYLISDILRPVQALVGVARQIGHGALQTRASVTVDDEIGDLARSFNDMTQSLLDKNQALAQAQQELEQRVLERTRELADSNTALSSEIAERKQAQARLQLAASVFTHAREGIVITDAQANIIDVNATFSQITGYSRAEVLGKNPRLLKSGRQSKAFYREMWRALSATGYWHGEAWNRRKNGEVYAEMLTVSAVRDAQDQVQHYVALFSDITPIKQHQQQLENAAHFDALTQLPNRLLLADRLDQAMLQCQRRKNLLAVAYLDLDGFKTINDHYGHDVGDELLVALAHSMKASLREGDTLARIGGDEFVAVLVDLNHFNDHQPLLERLLRAASAAISLDTRDGSITLQVSASAGVTLYPQDNADADLLMRHADQAMYAAKQSGKNRYRLFDVAHDAAVKVQLDSLARIRQALQQGELVLYYQPKVNLVSGRVTGAEALIRWQHPERGLLAPAHFLPVLEGQPLSLDVGEWVIASALAQMRHWQGQGLVLPVSVNLSAHQLQLDNFATRLAELLAACPEVAPQQLQLEVLETSSLEDLPRASASMSACQRLGVSFALDDFGTGYSSLTYLRRLPAQTLKIDQSFVRDMLDDPNDLAIVNGVIGLARAFEREVIAEGVETPAHGELLASIGCNLAQGYGIARPMPADQLPDWIAHWHARHTAQVLV